MREFIPAMTSVYQSSVGQAVWDSRGTRLSNYTEVVGSNWKSLISINYLGASPGRPIDVPDTLLGIKAIS